MIKKQLLKISLFTFFIAQQALASQTDVDNALFQAILQDDTDRVQQLIHDSHDASQALRIALQLDKYATVKAFMQQKSEQTAKSDLDRKLDQCIIAINCESFDRAKYDEQLKKLQSLQSK